MTPDPTGIEALLMNLEALQEGAMVHGRWAVYKAELALRFPALVACIRSQSRALAERERELDRMRYYLKLVIDVGRDDETRDVTPETAISLAQTWAELALASAPKGGGNKPLPPDVLVSAANTTIHRDVGKARPAKVVRVNVDSSVIESGETISVAPKGEGEGTT